MDAVTSRAIEYLKDRKIAYTLFTHPGPVSSLEQAARERGQQNGQVIRSILFRLHDDHFHMALVSGPRQVDWRKLRKHLATNRITMATPEEVIRVTGYRIGTVNPFGLPQSLPFLVDPRIKNFEYVSFGSGIPGVAIILKSDLALDAIAPFDWVEL